MRRSFVAACVLALVALGPFATSASAVTPTPGQLVPLGTLVGGDCGVQGGTVDGSWRSWEVNGVIPAFVHGGSGGVVLSPPAEQLPRFEHSPKNPFGNEYVLNPKLLASPNLLSCGVQSFDPLRATTLEEPGPHVFVQYIQVAHWVLAPSGTVTASPCAYNDPDFPSPSGYIQSPPTPDGDNVWAVDAFCNVTSIVGFYVQGTSSCATLGDMAHWPATPYVNQFDAGARLGLPVRFGKKGGNACGPSSLLMAMLVSAGPGNLPTLPQVFDGTMERTAAETTPEANNRFAASSRGLLYLKMWGWRSAKFHSLAGLSVLGVEQQILTSLSKGPVVISTAFGTSKWGVSGGGHMIAIVGADARGNFIVDDPAGNYFVSPKGGYFSAGHYGPGSCGNRALYPHHWLLAFVTGRYLLELGPRTPSSIVPASLAPAASSAVAAGPPAGSVILISDAHPGNADAPRSFYLQDASGRRAGWIDGQIIEEIPDSAVGQDTPGWTEPAAGDPSIDLAPLAPPATPRSLVVPDLKPGTTLHVTAAAGAPFALTAESWQDGKRIARDGLTGTGTDADTVVASPALTTLAAGARLAARAARVRTRAVSVSVSCAAAAKSTCGFSIVVTVKKRGRKVTFAKRAGTLASGKRFTVRLKAGAAGRKLLAGNRRLVATLLVTQQFKGAPAVEVRSQQLRI